MPMSTFLIETAIWAGVASLCTWLVGAWWHRRRTHAMVVQIARCMRSSTAYARRVLRQHELGSDRSCRCAALPRRRRTRLASAPTLDVDASPVRSLGTAGGLAVEGAPFLDTVATTLTPRFARSELSHGSFRRR